MNAVPHARGLALLTAHCTSLDPCAASARQRLDAAIGPELAHKLVFALCGSQAARGLGAGPVFAA